MAEILLNNVYAAFPVSMSTSQKSAFAAAASRMSFGKLGVSRQHENYVVAVQKLNLHIREGQRIGLMGRNGSGKSTLLRLISGIMAPSYGFRYIQGTIGCVLSAGTGLDVDKTGYQNMKLVARLQGLSGKALTVALHNAIDFCELGPFVEMPVRTYSAGMLGRLTFAIATARRAEIMLIDEVIGAGDRQFVQKAVERAREMCADSGISLVASHSDHILKGFSDIGVWMDAGEVMATGPIDDVIAAYTAFLQELGEI